MIVNTLYPGGRSWITAAEDRISRLGLTGETKEQVTGGLRVPGGPRVLGKGVGASVLGRGVGETM